MTSLEEMMNANEVYKDVMAQRVDVLIRLMDDIFGVGEESSWEAGGRENRSGIEDAVRKIVKNEADASRRGSHDKKCWQLYTTLVFLSSAAGGSEDRQLTIGKHASLLPTLFRILPNVHACPMLAETCAIAIYKLCARSPPNRSQILSLTLPQPPALAQSPTLLQSPTHPQSSSLNPLSLNPPTNPLSLLIDFFDVDFARTTLPGATANRGFSSRGGSSTPQCFVGWTHVLASFSVLQSSPEFPLTDAVLSRVHGMFAQVVSFWDSPLCNLLSFEGYSAMVSFTNSVCILHEDSDLRVRMEWVLKCACGTLSAPLAGHGHGDGHGDGHGKGHGHGGGHGVPLLTLYTDHLSRQMDHVSLTEDQAARIDFMIENLLRGLREELRNPAINGVRLGAEAGRQLEWMRIKLSAGTTLASLVRSLQSSRLGAGMGAGAGTSAASGSGGSSSSTSQSFSSPSSSSPSISGIHHGSGSGINGGSGNNSRPTEGVCAYPLCCNQDSLKLCGKCKKVAYCGSNCQKMHWAYHKHKCCK
jgi:hypothetical protein